MTKYDRLKEQLEWKIKDWRAEADELYDQLGEDDLLDTEIARKGAIAETKLMLAEKLEYLLLITERSKE